MLSPAAIVVLPNDSTFNKERRAGTQNIPTTQLFEKNRRDSPPPVYTINETNETNGDIDQYDFDKDDQLIVEPSEASSSDKLSVLTKLAYASVGLPYSMQLSIIAFYINYFLLDVAKVSPIYNAVILFTSRLIDGLTDPIGGYLFSRFSFRWGKMRPWILFSSPFVALCYFALWCLPNISEGGKFAYYFAAHSLLWTFMTASRIPHTALTVYLTLDQTERDQLTKYRTLFEAGGLLLSIAFHWGVTAAFGVTREICLNDTISSNLTDVIPTGVEANVAGAYMTSAGVVALLCILTSIFLFYNVREIVDVIPTSETSFIQGFKMILRYKPFLILTAATVASILATQSIQSVLELYLNHVKKNRTIFPFLAGSLIISTMILLFVWSIVMRKIGKKKSFLIGNLCLLPAVIIILISQSPMALLFVAAIFGANTVACGYVMPWAMLPECIDSFMLETGRRPVEIFYTLFFLGAKLAQALYAGLVQLALSVSGFDAKLCDHQPESVELTLRLLMGAVPGIIMVLSTICLYFYSIDDVRAKEIQQQLFEMRYVMN
ncbi:unnamed protein product [Adineta steineri]|uniref:Uncharacterized protein n=1 Tax=Adineta steineri TaxID=433720 RepID=A0A813WPV6_9BILA|nr:unnamed protein product [Adineta steineri]CAF0947265.1 unnamed protein product [Adineta steineri]